MELTSDTIMKLITSLFNKEWYSLITDISVDYRKKDRNNADAITVYVTFAEGVFDSIDDDKSEIEFEIQSDIRDIMKYFSPSYVFVLFP